MERNEELAERVCDAARRLSNAGLVAGTSGNVSAYDREAGCVYITPTNARYDTMEPEDIMAIDLDGVVLDGPTAPSSEWRLHTQIYRLMDEVNSVIHTHSPYATSFAVVGREVPLILVEMVPFLGGGIPVAPFSFPGTDEVGLNAARTLIDRGRNAALLKNHGVVAVGKNVEQTYLRAEYVEDASREYALALQVGEPDLIAKDVEAALREKYHLPKEA